MKSEAKLPPFLKNAYELGNTSGDWIVNGWGHDRYTALLDACVLYPVSMTDTLLRLATAGFFAAKWTAMIETEWTRSSQR
jgi:hypothetical protein